jgi:molybdopterin-guanine dinucleotide biosynthesis protein A
MARRPDIAANGRFSRSVAGIILAGGRNSRMGGADKAFLIVDGRTVFERTFDTLTACFSQVVVVSNDPQKYECFDVDVVQDEFPRQGPLAGIHAGLGRIDAPYAFVVACDMPFLHPGPIRFLVEQLSSQDAVIAEWDGDIEPLHGIYGVHLRPVIEQALRSGTRAIRDLLPQLRVQFIPEQLMRRVDGAEESFRNVNTPEEAARFDVHA